MKYVAIIILNISTSVFLTWNTESKFPFLYLVSFKKRYNSRQFPSCGQYKYIHQLSTNGFCYGMAGCEDNIRVSKQGTLTLLSHRSTVPCESLGTIFSRTSSFTFMAFEGNTRSLLSYFFLLHVKPRLLIFEPPYEFARETGFLTHLLWSKKPAW